MRYHGRYEIENSLQGAQANAADALDDLEEAGPVGETALVLVRLASASLAGALAIVQRLETEDDD